MAYDRAPETPHDPADADALKARREALRAFVAEIAEIAQTLPLPQTYLEADRAARALTVADRAVQVMGVLGVADVGEDNPTTASRSPSPEIRGGSEDTQHLRLKLRACADRVMEAATFIPKPDTFLEVERAQRYALSAERLLTQLYVAPKTKRINTQVDTPDGDDDYDPDLPEPLRQFTTEELDELRRYMPDGRLPVTEDDWNGLLERKLARYKVTPQIKPEPPSAVTPHPP